MVVVYYMSKLERADHAWDYTTIAAAILAYDKKY